MREFDLTRFNHQKTLLTWAYLRVAFQGISQEVHTNRPVGGRGLSGLYLENSSVFILCKRMPILYLYMGGRQNTMYATYDRSAIRGSALAGLVFATRRHHASMQVSGAPPCRR